MSRGPAFKKNSVVPDRQLIGHHDLVVGVGHQQPDGVLQDTLDELLLTSISSGTTAAPCRLLAGMVVLRRVDTAKVLAGVAALAAACMDGEEKVGNQEIVE